MIGQLTASLSHIYSEKKPMKLMKKILRYSYGFHIFIEIQLVYETNIRMTK